MGERAPRLVVGVGASAGGLEAFKKLLSVLPHDAGMSFLLVQHLDPVHKSLLSELLTPCTRMRVADAASGAKLQPNTVYVIPPDTALAVRGGKIELSAPVLHRGVRRPVDHLFSSLAREFGPQAVGIVLSGAGSDGSTGLRELKAAGGLAIAQRPESSSQSGMPQSAIDTGIVDLVLDIEEIPPAVARFAELPRDARDPSAAPAEPGGHELRDRRPSVLGEEDLRSLSAVLQAQLAFDVQAYKPATLERRVLRRMTVAGFDHPRRYLEQLRDDAAEQQALVRDLLINVTEFFRDRAAFEELRTQVIDPIVQAAPEREALRCWVPGCATGEEAYSIAMSFLDSIDRHDKKLELQLFATDIDQEALAVGRAGNYPVTIVEQVPPRHLDTYFVSLDGRGFRVRSFLRDKISFAAHDLTKDPPFSRMHLVSCRNLLIYIRHKVQERILRMLHFSLRKDGYLFLGTSESVGPQQQLFSALSKKSRIFRKVGASPPMRVMHSDGSRRRLRDRSPDPLPPDAPRRSEGARTAGEDPLSRVLLKARVPPTIVVSEDGGLLYMHGELRPYLRFPEGSELRFDLASMVSPELATRTRAALYRCRRDGETVVAFSDREVPGARTRITASPAPELGEGVVILSFEEVQREPTPAAPPDGASSEQDAIIEQLERELGATQEDLRNTVEELETSNEELRSSNEESMSMNEELQSANKELEATSEELRSLNEELTTVNAQLREKIDQLERAHDDLSNFFASTNIATLFLDEKLCIKRFTPAAADLLGINEDDVGRCMSDIARELLQEGLAEEAHKVLDQLSTSSRELLTGDGRWIHRQVGLYRTESRRIEGVVATFVDITDLKSTAERLATRERQQAVIARLGLRALDEPDIQGFLDQVVREVQDTLGTDFCKVLELQPGREQLFLRAGVGWKEGLVGEACVSAGLNSQAGFTLQADEPVIVPDLRTEKRFSGPALLSDHGVVSGISCVIEGHGNYGVLGAHALRPRVFTKEDADFMQAVASVIGSAVTRHLTRLRLGVERSVTEILARSRDIESAAQDVLRALGLELGTSVGELWWWDADGSKLVCRSFWADSRSDADRVRERFCKRAFHAKEGLIGSVFREQRAAWVTDLSDISRFLRGGEARELGLLSGLALPIVAAGAAVGVISIYSRERLIADGAFLRTLEVVGRSIGDFLRRLEVQDKVRRLAAIAESSHDAILTYGFDGRVHGWLGGAARLYGYQAEEMVGEPVDRLVPPERRQEQADLIQLVRSGDVIEPLETVRRRKDGTAVEVSVRVSPIRDDMGEVVAISSTDRDIGRQKAIERALIEADRQKDEFLAMLGHELRNPLAAVRNAAELLHRSAGDAGILEEAQAVIARQSTHMAKLLDGLLDVSRIIRGRIELERSVVDLAEICQEVAGDVQRSIAPRALTFTKELPEDPVWVEGDPTRLTQIVDNLLSNAVKYTPDGGRVRLGLEARERTAELTIADTGRGIAPEFLPHVFDVFRQSGQNLARPQGGLGLGLALVKSLVALHGGEAEAHSEGIGQGATFRVRIPITTKAPPPSSGRSEKSLAPKEILVVEDNEDAATMLKQILESNGHRVSVATRGAEGLRQARQRKPDVVLCDLGLPDGLTGFELAESLRADPATRPIHLVAITGYGRPADQARSSHAGFDAHLTKPVDIDTLLRVLARLPQRRDGVPLEADGAHGTADGG